MPIDLKHDTIEIALKKLKAREDNLRKIESVSKLGSWEIDLKTQQSVWSERSYEIYGVEKSTEVNIHTFYSLLEPQYLPIIQAALKEGIETGKHKTVHCKAKRVDGKIIDLVLNAQVIYDDENQPLKVLGTTQDITEYISIKNREQELSTLLEHSSNEIYIITRDEHRYLYVNQGACRALGYSEEELLTMSIYDINPNLTRSSTKEMEELLSIHDHILNKTTHTRKDGSLYTVQSYLHAISYNGKPAYVIFDTDITQEVQLQKDYEKQARILEYIHDSIIATDTEGKIMSWNRGSTHLLQYTADEMVGKPISDLYHNQNNHTLEELFGILDTKSSLNIEAYMYRKDLSSVLCDISLSISKDDEGNIDGYVGYIQDITEQKEIQALLEEQTKRLQYQAHHDALTHLPNRVLFKDRLTQTIASSKRNNEMFALLFIDLDQFKKINDSLGHHIGDKVLIEAATRLQSVLREEDTLARLGGDEFTIILRNLKSIQGASHVAQNIVDVMKETIHINKHNLYVTSSIGISIYPNDGQHEDDLVKFADVAMYRAKDEGRNGYQFYSSDMTISAFEQVVMESNLKIALKEDQFVVHYQPQFTIGKEKIVGMEALVRWKHPTLGLIPPGKFIPIAEENGLIIDIDNVVMKKAMEQFRTWYDAGFNPGILSLNLAIKQLEKEDYLVHLVNTMSEINFLPRWLELEVTEGQVMKNAEHSIKKLKQMHNMGIEIAIDDFGTGYSSLSYLKKLPLDKLKIDQSFIRDIPEDEDDMAITKAIIALGKSLNLRLIAEGVETQEQEAFLAENDCDLIQGYLYSRPIPADEITKLLESS